MVRKVTNQDRDVAIGELSSFLIQTSMLLEKAGWDWFVERNRSITEKFRPELIKLKRIPISTDGCEKSIYTPTVNMLCRFWHDVRHIELGLGYSKAEEYEVITSQIRTLQAAGLSSLALEIFWNDMWGQTEYYDRFHEFVGNQAAFVDSCLQHGIHTACIVRH